MKKLTLFLAVFLAFSLAVSNASASQETLKEILLSKNDVKIRGDINGDLKVDILDMAEVGMYYGYGIEGHPAAKLGRGADPLDVQSDTNDDGRVDVIDLATVGYNFGNYLFKPAAGAYSEVFTEPAFLEKEPGENFTVNIMVNTSESVFAVSSVIEYNSSVINATSVQEGEFLGRNGNGANTYPVIVNDYENGRIEFDSTRYGTETGVAGEGVIIVIEFDSIADGNADMQIIETYLIDDNLNIVDGTVVVDGVFNVTSNSPPVIAEIEDMDVNESEELSFTVTVSDPDEDDVSLSVVSGPGSVDDGVYSYPSEWDSDHENSEYEVTILADDGNGGTDTETFNITVIDVNRAPTMQPVDDVMFDEGDEVVFNLISADPESDSVSFSIVSGPGIIEDDEYSFSPAWDTDHDDNEYEVTILADDGNGGTDTETFSITVIDVNRPPVFTGVPSSPVYVDEGETLSFDASGIVSDPEGDAVTYIVSSGVGAFSGSEYIFVPGWDADHSDENYDVYMLANDSFGAVSEDNPSFMITVNDVNRQPSIEPVDDVLVDEGGDVYVELNSTDPDDDSISFSVISGPGSLDGDEYSFCSEWDTDHEDVVYDVTILADDGNGGNDTETFSITVIDVNRPPEADDMVLEIGAGAAVSFVLTGSDPENDSLDFGVVTPPEKGNLGGLLPPPDMLYIPSASSGTDSFEFSVDDGHGGTDTGIVTITINENNAPEITGYNPSGSSQHMYEEDVREFEVTASDPDMDDLDYEWKIDGGVVGSGTSYLFDAPELGSNHDVVYELSVTVSDGRGGSDTHSWEITVSNVNTPPVAYDIDVGTGIDMPVQFMLSAEDTDGDDLNFYYLSQPDHGQLSWTEPPQASYVPDQGYTGTDSFQFGVDDGYGGTDSATVYITVSPGGSAGIILDYNPHTTFPSVPEGHTQNFAVYTNAGDWGGVSYEWKLNQEPVSFTSHYSFRPGHVPGHSESYYSLSVKATSNGGETDFQTWGITVTDVNLPPEIRPIPDKEVYEGKTLDVVIEAEDDDGDTVTFSLPSGPGGMTGGTYSVSVPWDSDHEDEVYDVTVNAEDGYGGTDSETFTVTVRDVNRNPVMSPVEDKSVNEGDEISFSLSAADPESDSLEFEIMEGPGSVTGDTYSYESSWDTDHENENHQVKISVSDGHGGTDEVTFEIVVNDVNRAPAVESHSPENLRPSITETESILFSVSMSDEDSDSLSYIWWVNDSEVSTEESYEFLTDYDSSGDHDVILAVTDGYDITTLYWFVSVLNADTVSFDLSAGSNVVTLPRTPADTSIESVLESVEGKYNSVMVYDESIEGDEWDKWLVYDPAAPPFLNTLHELDGSLPFHIEMNQEATLTVSIE